MAKILLVEDDNNLREIYEARLQAEGYEIVSARDGEEALTVAMKERPDLIISDVMMPKISGFDMLDIIRSTEETKNAKVIMMTALSQAEDKERATKLGADRYLVKSQVTLEDVAKVAREVLSGDSTTKTEDSTATTPAPVAPVATTEPAVTTPADTPAVASEPVDSSSSTPTPGPTSTPAPTSQATTTPAEPKTEPTSTTPTPLPITPATEEPASSTTPAEPPVTPQPVTTSEPATTTPTTEPIVSQEDSTSTNSTPAPTDASTDKAEASAVAETEALSESLDDEQAEISNQIEDFIASNNTTAPEQASTPQTSDTESQNDSAKPESKTDQPPLPSQAPKKRVIEPINDPTKSSGPDLTSLLKKEEEKEQMAEIAKNLANDKKVVDKADEDVAAAELRAAARSVEAVMPETPTEEPRSTEVKITEGGEIQPSTAPQSTTNGTNIDGVKPAPPETEAPEDPNSIAL